MITDRAAARLVVLAAWCAAGSAWAQVTPPAAAPTPSTTAASASPAADPSTYDLTRYAVRAISRLAVLDLRCAARPGSADYAAAAMLFELAERFAPNDDELIRRSMEAWWNADDLPRAEEATRRLLRVDPRDTVAQLRLVSSRIAALNTSDERIAAYQRLLGPAGASLDDSVKSRLALDLALLLKERGDGAGFIDALTRACQLDGTNKDAALLALNSFAERTSEPMGELELTANLLYADPLDPRVHMQLRDLLARHGAFEAALRFHTSGEALLTAGGFPSDATLIMERHVLTWRGEGPQKPVDALNRELRIERYKVDEQARIDQEVTGLPPQRTGADVRLAIQFEQVRASAALAAGDAATLDASLTDMAASINRRVDILSDPSRRGGAITEEQALSEVQRLRTEIQLWRLVTGAQLDKVEGELDAAIAGLAEDDERVLALTTWRLVRRGDLQAALERAQTVTADRASPARNLARAVALNGLGRRDEAVAILDEIISEQPVTVLGAISAWQREQMGGKPSDVLAERMEAYAQSIPKWIDTMLESPRNFQSLTVKLEADRLSALDPARMRIRIRNLLPIPLALGSGRTINTRLLLAPHVEVRVGNLQGAAQPEVVEVDRRLRLLPGETVEIPITADWGITSLLAETLCDAPVRQRFRIVQGFVAGAMGPREPGPGSMSTVTEPIIRQPLSEALLSGDELARRLRESGEESLAPLLVGARARMLATNAEGAIKYPGERATLMNAIVERFPSLSPTARAVVLASVPPRIQLEETAPLDALLAEERDPMVLMVGLATRVTEAGSPVLEHARSLNDPTLTRYAELHAQRLAGGGGTFAQLGPAGSFRGTVDLPPVRSAAP